MNNGNKTLVQSTIFSAMHQLRMKAKAIKTKPQKKSYILTVIEIDSDSDSPVDKDVEKPETTKRKISVPFSDDDDEDPNNSSENGQAPGPATPNNKNDAVSECESITSNDSQRTILLNTSISPKRSDKVKIIDNINLSTQQSEGVPSSNCAKNEVSGTERTPKKQKLCQAGKKETQQGENLTKVTGNDVSHSSSSSVKTGLYQSTPKKAKLVGTPKSEGIEQIKNIKRDILNFRRETMLSSSSSPSASQIINRSTPKCKKEGKSINLEPIQLITDLFNDVSNSVHLRNLIPADKKAVAIFFKLDRQCQFVCLKLFTRQKKWYNIHKFCNLVSLDIDDSDLNNMYTIFKENHIIDTDYMCEDFLKLLNLLELADLKYICNKFKSNPKSQRRDDLIKSLFKFRRTQSVLFNSMPAEELLKREIKLKMGKCMRLNKDFHDAFYRTFVLGTFMNSDFITIADYFRNPKLLGQFPKYTCQDYLIFCSEENFKRYERARRYRIELEEVGNNHIDALRICSLMFEELKKLKEVENDAYENAPYLIRYTARAVYVSGLSSAIKILATKFPTEAKTWLEYMIENETKFDHRIGEWYYSLTWLYMKYIKPHDYQYAAELLIKVFLQHEDQLSDIQLHMLGTRGQLLKVSKKYKIAQGFHDTIAELIPKLISIDEFPQITIDANTIRGNEVGKRRHYVSESASGDKDILTVEQTALRYYRKHGNYKGVHCEGTLIKATFALFFWDIIYMDHLPATFISKIQSVPLDMYTKHFYLRRKESIDKRLKEIESEWSDNDVLEWLNKHYDEHCDTHGFCQVSGFIEEREFLQVWVECVGRPIMAKIYDRYVKNIRIYSGGLPDLLIWNVETKTSKFVEVKGENDKLSLTQTLWLNYLKDIGATVEVCHVHSIGSKRKGTLPVASSFDAS